MKKGFSLSDLMDEFWFLQILQDFLSEFNWNKSINLQHEDSNVHSPFRLVLSFFKIFIGVV